MNLLVIVFVLGVTFAWMIRGMFNSMLHMICVIAAGAIAFSVWEPLALMIIGASPERGFMSFLESVAWGVALLVPFVVSLLLLRTAVDKLVPGNIVNSTIVDYAGGAICGVVTSVISAGILIIGIGSMRVPTKFMNYQPVWYSADRATAGGSLVRSDKLWIPVDRITSVVYSQLSKGTMSTSEPLAKWYPELELVGFSARISPGDGSGRNAIASKDFKVVSTYIVGDPKGTDKVSDLLKDSVNNATQKYVDVNSKPVANGYLMGYVIDFEPGAKERGKKGGQLVVSSGQYRLLVEDKDGNTNSVFPVATISESTEANQFGRWRFDAEEIFITSVGGKSRVTMGFEFVVPQGHTPLALFVKNIRVDQGSLTKPVEYADTTQRDRIVQTGSILKGESSARKLDTSRAVKYNATDRDSLIRQSTSISQIMSTQIAKRGLTIDEANKNAIVDGEGIYDIKTDVGRSNAPQGKALKVERFAVDKGQQLIRIDVGVESEIGFLSDAARDASLDEPLILIDDKGNEYQAIGYEYTDTETFHVRYTRGSTLTGVQDTPSLSRNDPDRKLVLLFVITDGVKISYFTIGDTAVAQFVPPFEAN